MYAVTKSFLRSAKSHLEIKERCLINLQKRVSENFSDFLDKYTLQKNEYLPNFRKNITNMNNNIQPFDQNLFDKKKENSKCDSELVVIPQGKDEESKIIISEENKENLGDSSSNKKIETLGKRIKRSDDEIKEEEELKKIDTKKQKIEILEERFSSKETLEKSEKSEQILTESKLVSLNLIEAIFQGIMKKLPYKCEEKLEQKYSYLLQNMNYLGFLEVIIQDQDFIDIIPENDLKRLQFHIDIEKGGLSQDESKSMLVEGFIASSSLYMDCLTEESQKYLSDTLYEIIMDDVKEDKPVAEAKKKKKYDWPYLVMSKIKEKFFKKIKLYIDNNNDNIHQLKQYIFIHNLDEGQDFPVTDENLMQLQGFYYCEKSDEVLPDEEMLIVMTGNDIYKK